MMLFNQAEFFNPGGYNNSIKLILSPMVFYFSHPSELGTDKECEQLSPSALSKYWYLLSS